MIDGFSKAITLDDERSKREGLRTPEDHKGALYQEFKSCHSHGQDSFDEFCMGDQSPAVASQLIPIL